MRNTFLKTLSVVFLGLFLLSSSQSLTSMNVVVKGIDTGVYYSSS